MVCDAELYSLKAPEGYSELTSSIKNVIVGGEAGQSDLFASAQA